MSAEKKPAAKAPEKKGAEPKKAAEPKKSTGKMARLKRAFVPYLLGALSGVGGLTGFEYVSGAGNLSIMQHLQGDSATVALADSAAKAAPAPAPDTLATPVADTMPAVAIDTTGMAPQDSAVAFGEPVEPARDTVNRLPPRRLAKFFGSMQAREAARVLEKMTDPEVETILTQLSDREAASILSNLTPERAAQISQVVISGERNFR